MGTWPEYPNTRPIWDSTRQPQKREDFQTPMTIEEFNLLLSQYREQIPAFEMGAISYGFHTFEQLYQHRSMLWVALLNLSYGKSFSLHPCWKSRKHQDGSMFEGYFVAGMGYEPGEQMAYHLKEEYWDKLNVPELEQAPEWDGHTGNDVLQRLERWFS